MSNNVRLLKHGEIIKCKYGQYEINLEDEDRSAPSVVVCLNGEKEEVGEDLYDEYFGDITIGISNEIDDDNPNQYFLTSFKQVSSSRTVFDFMIVLLTAINIDWASHTLLEKSIEIIETMLNDDELNNNLLDVIFRSPDLIKKMMKESYE